MGARRLGAGVLALVLGVGAACDRERDLAPTGPTRADGIVLESAELETVGLEFRCEVHGRIRNEGPKPRRVTLIFTAFDRRDAVIGTALVFRRFVPPGTRVSYEARFRNFSDDGFLNDCDRVHRFEVRIEVEPV